MAQNIRPITSKICDTTYPSANTGVSFTTSCSGNPSLNSLLQNIDDLAQTKSYLTISHSCSLGTDFVCDGTADQVEIQDAITAVMSAPQLYKGIVLIPDADYVINATVALTGISGLTIKSFGKAVIRPATSLSLPVVTFTNSSKNILKNLKLTNGSYNVVFSNSSYNILIDSEIDTSGNQHLLFSNSNNNKIINNSFVRAGQGVMILGAGGATSYGNIIQGNTFELNNELDFSGLYSVIMGDTGNVNVISGNVSIDDSTKPNRAKRFVESVGGVGNVNGWSVTGNTIAGIINTGVPVVLAGTGHQSVGNASI